MQQILSNYKNGNYYVRLYSNGTKEKFTNDDFFDAEFPDSIDLKITNYCDLNCPMCHEKSSETGTHADLSAEFIDTLCSGTELAIGGGNPLSHPNLTEFLEKLKNKQIIANLTINEQHLLKNIDKMQFLIDNKLIWGLGISLNEYNEKTFEFARKNKNVVFHLILGITTTNLLKKLYDKNYKILLLGYKKFGRGEEYFSEKIENEISNFEKEILTIFSHFNAVSFDNLALTQLKLKSKLSPKIWEEFYMGDDGESTMYIDLVNKQFALSSTSTNRFPLMQNIKDMFNVIKK